MKTKKTLKMVLIVILILAVFAVAGMYLMFSREFKIIKSIEKHEGPHPFYVMDFEDDYFFDEVFSNNISSDGDLADVLSGYIALFFVDGKFHRNGIGRQLFQTIRSKCPLDRMTVHSSPYAVPIYHKLGFCDTDTEQIPVLQRD